MGHIKAIKLRFPHFRQNTFVTLTVLYLAVLLLISLIGSYISYHQRRAQLISDMDYAYVQLKQEFIDTLDNFWQLYMPIFEKNSTVYPVLSNYFVNPSGSTLNPLEKSELSEALHQLLLRDNRIQWVALYSENREDNFMMFNSSRNLIGITEDFPYLENIRSKGGNMEIYGTELISDGAKSVQTFALCGGTPFAMAGGQILAGYSLSALEHICNSSEHSAHLPSLTYMITSDSSEQTELVFHSGGVYEEEGQYLPTSKTNGETVTVGHSDYYIRSGAYGDAKTYLSYMVSSREMLFYSHRNTPLILVWVLGFFLMSVLIYALVLRSMEKEIHVIRDGLSLMGENHLDYRLPTDLKQGGFSEIAESINQMAVSLNDNINRAYYYELKQKQAELAELQSKFNPHFLYNSLEMLRSRCIQSGDIETADLISSLSGIFRGFIGSKTFIPLPEELAFTRRYLSLFGARYQDQLQIQYDISSEVLSYGIVRNLFQPLIENYFVHGYYSKSDEQNYLCISGHILDEHFLLFTVADNGMGMTDEDLAALNAKINEPITLSTESYGLKNLQQRIQLFYGKDCGITIRHNDPHGLSIEIKVRRMLVTDVGK